MTTTTKTPTTTTLRRMLLAGLAPLLAMLAIVGMAGQSHAASRYTGTIAVNSYYGAASGEAGVSASKTNYSVGVFIKDVRTDGYCTTLQMQALSPSGAGSGFTNVGFNCSTSQWKLVWQGRDTSGWSVTNVQVRMCQSDQSGRVVGTCSAPVNATNWRVG